MILAFAISALVCFPSFAWWCWRTRALRYERTLRFVLTMTDTEGGGLRHIRASVAEALQERNVG